MIREQSLFLGI